MQLFNSGFFWFFEGILFCLAIIGLKVWAEDRSIPMPFWKWIAFAVWMVLFGFTVAFIGTSLGENEVNAAVKGGILFGIIVAISGVGLWRLIKIGIGNGEEGTQTGPEERPA
ncbi:MAG: dehalogenase [Candidatus Latescibacteria bacterium]|nr:dehalogenase [Candidatus Latescibacterota bacterium]